MLLSRLAEHTQNLDDHAEASMLVTEAPGRHEEVLALGRVTLLGRCAKVAAFEVAEVRATFLAAQPRAAYYVDFADFAFYRLEPTALRYVGGFGRMSWVGAEGYASAKPDPLAGAATGILAHMNDDHGDALLAYLREGAAPGPRGERGDDDRGRSLRLRHGDQHAKGAEGGASRVR